MATPAEISVLLTAKDNASATLKKAGGNFAQFGDIAKKAGLAVGAGLVGIAAVSIKAAADAQVISTQTAAVIASTKGVAGVTQKAVEDLATSLSLVTPFEDDLIQKTQNMLLTFTNISKDVFPAVTETALDMAQALGGDPVQQSIALGKALNDPIKGITALTRVGVTFTEDQKAVIRTLQESGDVMGAQKIILAELATEFGGSARAAGKTFAGQLEIAKNALGNVAEAIGGPLITALTDLFTQVSPVIVAFGEKIPEAMAILGELFDVLTGRAPDAGAALTGALGRETAETIMRALATVRETVKTVMGFITDEVVPRVVAAVQFVREHWDAFGPAFAGIALFVIVPALVAWGAAAIAAAAATIIAFAPVILALVAIGAAAALFAMIWRDNLGDVQGKTEAVVGAISSFFEGMQLFVLEVWRGIVTGVSGAVNAVIGVINGFIGAYNTVAEKLALPLLGTIQMLTPNLSEIDAAIDAVASKRRVATIIAKMVGGGGSAGSGVGRTVIAAQHGFDGIVSRPTLFMAGEAGREHVRVTPGGHGGGGDVHLQFNAPIYGMLDFERQVVEAMRRVMTRGGFSDLARVR